MTTFIRTRTRNTLSIAALVSSIALSASVFAQDVDLESDNAKIGYTYGVQIGQGLIDSDLIRDIDLDAMIAAIRDITANKESQLSAEQQQAAREAYAQRIDARLAALASNNKAQSDGYMAKNGEKAGVVTTDSGLQYEILREGKGKRATADSLVKVHYSGKTIDGETFDSSYDRGAPATFGTSQVIPGFSEGLQLMQEGGKIRLHIPADMAYGEQAPANIGPNQALIFEIELIEVSDANPPAQAQ